VLIERVILAGTPEERDASLAALLTLQRKDFSELLDVMDGLPVNIRLLDPPLHEFLPDRTELAVRVAVAEARGESGPELEADRKVLAAVENLHESNPMLGLRGVRLGLVTPGLFALQVRAIGEAASDQIVAGMDPRVEIMVPLVGSVMELHLVRDEAERILAEVATEKGVTLQIPIGTMIELPRGAHRTPDRRGRGLLLVRHQRPDADDVGLLPAMTWNRLCLPPIWRRACSPSRRSRPSTPTGWAAGADRRRGGPPGQARPEAGCAVSTVVIPNPSTSSTTPGWTTCPVHRSGCPSPAWKPRRRQLTA
jgi:hypothetical protein